MLHVVAVDRADVVEAELLEQRAAGHQAARILLGALGGDLDGLGEALDDLAPEMAQRAELLGRQQAREILVERADRRGDRHVVVVEDDDQRSEDHTSELQSLMRISYAVFCLKKK